MSQTSPDMSLSQLKSCSNIISTDLVFFVNGKKVIEENANPEWTLLFYLRTKLNLCGTKLGCAEGGCGACTVMVSKLNRINQTISHVAVNACLAPVCAMHGLAVTTIEGIGSTKTRLHPVQERIAKAHGSQCGFCTPGIVMSMYSLLRNLPKPSMKDLEIAFQGNLCRCTGYRPIIEGYKTLTEDWEQEQRKYKHSYLENGKCALGEKCCKKINSALKTDEVLFNPSEFTPYDPTQEPIFPPELMLSPCYDNQNLLYKGPNVVWHRPNTLDQLVHLKSLHPDAKIIVGNTEVGVEVKFKNFLYPVLINPCQIKELTTIKKHEKSICVGAACTLDEIDEFLKQEIKEQPEYKTRIFTAIVEMLHWFAGKQIRNVAAIGGNLMTSSPISDLNPILMAASCELDLISKRGPRKVLVNEHFFTSYRKNVIDVDEVLVSINIPYTKESQYFCAFKQAKRRDDDIAIVNAAFNIELAVNTNTLENIRIAYGGMAPTTVMALKTGKALRGKVWKEDILEIAYENLLEDLPLSPSAPGGMIQYRRALTLSLFFKAYLYISEKYFDAIKNLEPVPPLYKSGSKSFEMVCPKSSQFFAILPNTETAEVGKPKVHVSAFKQASGEAVYCDDIPRYADELYLAFVLSSKAHANILSIDPSEALAMPDVTAFFSANDLNEYQNSVGSIVHDEQIFVDKTVQSHGQVLGVIVAKDQITAQRAARKVKVTYEDLQPVIITIEDAIKHQSFYPNMPKKLTKGDVDAVFNTSDHIIEGEIRMGGQEHFYFETHAVLAVPKNEDDEMEIFSSTQHPSEISKLVAHMLDIPISRVVTRVKRLGGGFGGKESRGMLIALPAALAAYKLKKPVRCMLDRDEDMLMTGGRHPFLFKYKCAFSNEGKILACEVEIYNNAGYSLDLSQSVLERAMFHFQNAYLIPNVRVLGYVCKTNLPSNTAFRGFGGPQGMFVAENMIRDIANKLNKDPLDIAKLNLYKEGDSTHYNQILSHCTLSRCLEECLALSNFEKRSDLIKKFNSQNRWKKRGISLVPTAFGIAFTALFLNQTGALIHVYTDGSVLLTHGGVEMGQGLHTKMTQVASRALGIPMSKIHISETATNKVPNTSPTAASAGSDLNGMAVLNACEIITERLRPYKEKNPKGTWEQWVQAAYFDRVSLSTNAFYKTPIDGYNWETNSGTTFNYYTYGVGCSEVEIDCLTGDHRVLRTDLVMDLGESINPAIDIGQIEGAFMQGYGLFTLEELMYSSTGVMFTRGPGAYKIPGFADIPLEFNVSLLKGAPNPRAIYSSKAVGEPPLFLASSTFFAIKEAIKASRSDAGVEPHFRLDAPATAAKIRMACEDNLTTKIMNQQQQGAPWNVIP